MEKFETIKTNYLAKGVKERNIDYAADAVVYGTKRELILENLTSATRGESKENANLLLDDLYKAHGGEFKYANRWGFFYGILFLLIAFGLGSYIYYSINYSGIWHRPIATTIATIGFTIAGFVYIVKAILKRHKEVG